MASSLKHGRPPPLPPQASQSSVSTSTSRACLDEPPPYQAIQQQQKAYAKAKASDPRGLLHNDPRSSSQQSLLPACEETDRRRKLLLVYIHGFLGADTSFRSFPAHVHYLLAILLSDTHVVHSKIYPRYKSKGRITNARDDLSRWLEPHEHPSTDIVLLGHSMGGLLSAEVALMPPAPPASRPLQHRIVGTINFDVPFLGMHPGVVKSGLSSIFNPAEETDDKYFVPTAAGDGEHRVASPSPSPEPNRTDTLWAPESADPNYNPSFQNDVVLPVRKGWRSAWHFVNKHSDDLAKATKKLVSSHLEFGGAMANYHELKNRYARLRALEEADERVRQSIVQGGTPPRIRFINYYTASTGRPKRPKAAQGDSSESPQLPRQPSHTGSSVSGTAAEGSAIKDMPTLKIDDEPHGKGFQENITSESSPTDDDKISDTMNMPARPAPLDVSYIQDPATRALVQQEHYKAVQAYEAAMKSSGRRTSSDSRPERISDSRGKQQSMKSTVRGRQSLAAKPESELSQSDKEELRLERERQRMNREARRLRGEPEPEPSQLQAPSNAILPAQNSRSSSKASRSGSVVAHDADSQAPSETKGHEDQKSKKDRMFCNLPPKDSHGERDPTWVRVFMENVDEVGAHCGLFFVDERYERLVGDVASRIETWVNDENGHRVSQAWSSKP
ncbi:hypothetical protein AC579_8912 [Pseudocercospora musae]|uniref:DUF676 domain-containing protein n=1 Tax=Pseudocercospora musae TaxID=113226 RepID=A0A139IDP7_9PEZI|nr:hypothetical protein AC579_8912 [Pseudocercospora musae]